MIVLIITAILAFYANGVISEEVVIAKGWCTSTIIGFLTYKTRYCHIPNATPDQKLNVVISDERSPYKCSSDTAQVIKYNGQMYIEVKDGCDGYFEVSIVRKTATWNAWSDWSTCSKQCRHSRSRTCSTGNVTDCEGESTESKVCYDGECESKVSNLDGCGVANPVSGFRVVGGAKAGKCQYPWMVVVYNHIRKTLCGGSILDKRHILTAAHCVKDSTTSTVYPASHFIIFSGSSDISSKTRQQHQTTKIIPHKNYVFNSQAIKDDIAVIRLSSGLKFDKCHRPICLSNGSRSVHNGKKCRVMGWGYLNNNKKETEELQWTLENPVSRSDCYREYGSDATSKTFCAIGQNSGACSGDSGGPFTCMHEDGKFYQYGIVSAGKEKSCGRRYTLYTYINAYSHWINQAIHS